MDTPTPKIGDYLIPDGWHGIGENLLPGDAPVDASYPGCQFRMPVAVLLKLWPVNITITGRKPDRNGLFRCKIEWVHDGEASEFSGGKILIRR
jgi:hypothetical protein